MELAELQAVMKKAKLGPKSTDNRTAGLNHRAIGLPASNIWVQLVANDGNTGQDVGKVSIPWAQFATGPGDGVG